MLAMCASTVLGARNNRSQIGLVGAAFGHQGEDLALPLRQVVQGHPCAPPADQLGDHLGVDDGAALGDAPDGIGEVVEIVDPVLEEIADPTGAVGHQAQGEGRFDVLREDEDADRRAMLVPDRLGGAEALVGVGRRHPDVDDGDVRLVLTDSREELGRVASLGDDLEACLVEQPRDPLPEEDRIVGERDPQGHVTGSIARMAMPDSSSLGMKPSARLRARRGP